MPQPELTSFYPPRLHHARHESGGDDPIQLDNLAAPDDTTDLDASTLRHGLLKKLPNDATKFLDGQGNFSVPPTPAAGGQLLAVQVYTSSGADTYIPTVGCTTAIIFALGAGGGGGGVTGATSNANAAAAGGSGGGWSWLITPVTQAHTYVVAIGAAGTAATAGNNAGGTGGDTTIETDGGSGLIRAKGGAGGSGMGQSTAAKANGGTAGVAGTTGGNLNMTGIAGGASFCVATSVAMSGKGGDSPYGAGGRSLTAIVNTSAAAGVAATGFGAGGGGAVSFNDGTSRAGGAGTLGLLIIWEYAEAFDALFE